MTKTQTAGASFLSLLLLLAIPSSVAGPSGYPRAWLDPPEALVLVARANQGTSSLYLRALCAGFVVRNGEVVTASHCVKGDPAASVAILHPGDLCQRGPEDSLPVRGISNRDISGDTITLDVPGALASEPVGTPPSAGTALVAWGWGGQSSARRSCLLHSTLLTPLPSQECSAHLTAAGLAKDQFFCVVPKAPGGPNTCSGDSGGPVLWLRGDGSAELVGITSSGMGCGANSVGFVAIIQQ